MVDLILEETRFCKISNRVKEWAWHSVWGRSVLGWGKRVWLWYGRMAETSRRKIWEEWGVGPERGKEWEYERKPEKWRESVSSSWALTQSEAQVIRRLEDGTPGPDFWFRKQSVTYWDGEWGKGGGWETTQYGPSGGGGILDRSKDFQNIRSIQILNLLWRKRQQRFPTVWITEKWEKGDKRDTSVFNVIMGRTEQSFAQWSVCGKGYRKGR